MSNSKPNYFQRRTKPQGPRANERIRALDVQVIGSDGTNLGAMPLKQAIDLAKQEDLDLIEVHDNFTISEIIALEEIGIFKREFIYLPRNNKKQSYVKVHSTSKSRNENQFDSSDRIL